MTLTIEQGDLFASDADALVNPVNCKGVMGAGVAKQMLDRFPEPCKTFNQHSKRNGVRPGRAYRYSHVEVHHIIMLTTKDHWRDPSKLDWIRNGVEDLRKTIARYNFEDPEHPIDHVAMPAIGCGYGGLDWPDVRVILEDQLEDSEVTYEVRLR